MHEKLPDCDKLERLRASGWEVGSVAEFLGLSAAEDRYIELRLRLADALRERRSALGFTQKAAAKRLNISQSYVAKLENARPGVTVDRMLLALLELDVTLEGLASVIGGEQRDARKKSQGDMGGHLAGTAPSGYDKSEQFASADQLIVISLSGHTGTTEATQSMDGLPEVSVIETRLR